MLSINVLGDRVPPCALAQAPLRPNEESQPDSVMASAWPSA
jgi:hypothetical protein